MKKKIAALLTGVCMMSVMLSGCGSKLSNDYITISKYKGVEVEEQETTEVTDEYVEQQIDALLESMATTEEVTDRAVEEGDTAKIDYVGSIDGVEFEGGSSLANYPDGYDLVIGSGSFIPGFEDQIIGHSAGESFDINVTFPEDYDNADCAGKDAVFAITLRSITTTTTPELTDELVQTLSEDSKTVEEYKKEAKQILTDNVKASEEASLKEAAWNAILENTEVTKYPTEDLQKLISDITAQYEQKAEEAGLEFADYLSQEMNNMDEDTFNAKAAEVAKSQIKSDLIVDLIAKKEKLTLTDKEFEEKYEELATSYGFEDVDALKEVAEEEDLKAIVMQDVVQTWVADNCKQVKAKESDSTSTTTTE